METIQFQSVLPQVFAQRNDLDSEIWQQDVSFEKGHLYLVEADSGKGKSTFCSYVLGYRHDYSGNVLFDKDVTAHYQVKDWVEVRKRHISHLFQELRIPHTDFLTHDKIISLHKTILLGEHRQDILIKLKAEKNNQHTK